MTQNIWNLKKTLLSLKIFHNFYLKTLLPTGRSYKNRMYVLPSTRNWKTLSSPIFANSRKLRSLRIIFIYNRKKTVTIIRYLFVSIAAKSSNLVSPECGFPIERLWRVEIPLPNIWVGQTTKVCLFNERVWPYRINLNWSSRSTLYTDCWLKMPFTVSIEIALKNVTNLPLSPKMSLTSLTN